MARRRPAEPTANPARGAALVVVAVVIGLFLLRERARHLRGHHHQGRQRQLELRRQRLRRHTTDGNPDDTTTTTAARCGPRPRCPRSCSTTRASTGAAGAYTDAARRRSATSSPTPTAPTRDAERDAASHGHLLRAGLRGRGRGRRHRHRCARRWRRPPLPTVRPGQIAGASVVVVLGTGPRQRHAHHGARPSPPAAATADLRGGTPGIDPLAALGRDRLVARRAARLRRHAGADRAGGGRRPAAPGRPRGARRAWRAATRSSPWCPGRPVAFLQRPPAGARRAARASTDSRRIVDGESGVHPEAEAWRPVIDRAAASGGRDGPPGGSTWSTRDSPSRSTSAVSPGCADACAPLGGRRRRPLGPASCAGRKMSVELHPPVAVDKGTVVEARAAGAGDRGLPGRRRG